MLSYMNYLYILHINSLSVLLFANMSSHSVGCLFILLVSFAVQKFLTLIRSHFSIFAFFALGPDPSTSKISTLYVRVFCPCFLLDLHV